MRLCVCSNKVCQQTVNWVLLKTVFLPAALVAFLSCRNPLPAAKSVESLKHDEAKRKNIPTAEYQSVLQKEEQNPVRVEYRSVVGAC